MPARLFGGDLVSPDYGGGSITSIGAIVEAALGLGGTESPPLAVLGGQTFRRVLLVTLDALGEGQADAGLQHSTALRALFLLGERHRLTSVYPSTTSAALTSLFSGATPAGHGILGHNLFIPALGGIANTLKFSPRGRGRRDVYAERGFRSRDLFSVTPIHERLTEAGVAGTFITRSEFKNTGLGRLHRRGARFVGYQHLADGVAAVRQALTDASGPAFISFYWDVVDQISHFCGPRSDAALAATDMALHALQRLLVHEADPSLSANTLLLVTADHGQIAAPPEQAVWLGDHPEITAELLLPPTGSARSGYLHARPGRADALREQLTAIEDRVAIAPTGDALDAGLWGPPEAAARHRVSLGDFVFHCRGNHTLLPTDKDPDRVRPVSRHGGLTPEEMRVPLFAIPLAKW